MINTWIKIVLTNSLLILTVFLSKAQSVEVIDTSQLFKIISQPSQKPKIISFWATWCKPCVQEMPYLEDMNLSGKADVILISLDFLEDIDTKVAEFVSEHDLTSRVYLLDNIDYNSWIDKVDNSWSGAIPATLIIDSMSRKRKLIEGSILNGDLDMYINDFNN